MERTNAPQIAIVGRNILANIGLTTLIQGLMPVAKIETFSSTSDMIHSGFRFFHYFVTLPAFISCTDFYFANKRQTVILFFEAERLHLPEGFRSLCMEMPEKEIVRTLVGLQQAGHHGGKSLPNEVKQEMEETKHKNLLTSREIEVLRLIVGGYINKEIADKLGVAPTTIISHRKNIIQKLNIKSVSSLTLYAVLHGYIQPSEI